MTMKNQELSFRTHGKSQKRPFETPFEGQPLPSGPTPTASALLHRNSDVMKDLSLFVFRPEMLVALQPHTVIKKTRRRHSGSPLLCFSTKEVNLLGGDFSSHLLILPRHTPAFAR